MPGGTIFIEFLRRKRTRLKTTTFIVSLLMTGSLLILSTISSHERLSRWPSSGQNGEQQLPHHKGIFADFLPQIVESNNIKVKSQLHEDSSRDAVIQTMQSKTRPLLHLGIQPVNNGDSYTDRLHKEILIVLLKFLTNLFEPALQSRI
jgi:hypothetical protein